MSAQLRSVQSHVYILAAMNDFGDTCRTDFPDYLHYLFVRFLLNKRDLDIIIILVYIVIYL